MQRRHDHGSVTAELVLLTPVFVLLLLLVAFAGRVGRAQTSVRHAADQAARAASLRQTPGQAAADARAVAVAELNDSSVSCVSPQVVVDTSELRPGGVVRVTVRCTADLHDLGLLGVPGHRSFSASSIEVVDRRRAG
jgi:Flp pilus assembly protein TadG